MKMLTTITNEACESSASIILKGNEQYYIILYEQEIKKNITCRPTCKDKYKIAFVKRAKEYSRNIIDF